MTRKVAPKKVAPKSLPKESSVKRKLTASRPKRPDNLDEFMKIVADVESAGHTLPRSGRAGRGKRSANVESKTTYVDPKKNLKKRTLGRSKLSVAHNIGAKEEIKWHHSKTRARLALEEESYVHSQPEISDTPEACTILKQRDVEGQSLYLVDWCPSWVEAKSVPQQKIDEWEIDKDEHTLIDNVCQMYWNFMYAGLGIDGRTVESLAAELFQQDEWEIYDGAANRAKFKRLARKTETNGITSAAGLMQRIFIECSRHGVNQHLDTLQSTYKDILVQYNGEIDDRSTVHQLQPPEGKAAREFIEPIFDRRVRYVNRVEGSSKAMDTWENMRVADGAENLAENCPYLFRHPWPLAFISLYCRDYTMKNVLGDPGDWFNRLDSQEGQIALADWKERAREQIMNTYLHECEWETRSVDEVWRTFLEAQIILSRKILSC